MSSIASPAGFQSETNTLNVGVWPARPGSASHGERALLPLRTFEVGVAHTYEYDSRLALHGNQLDDIRRYGSVLGMQAQSDCQYFRNACSDGKPCIAWPQQR